MSNCFISGEGESWPRGSKEVSGSHWGVRPNQGGKSVRPRCGGGSSQVRTHISDFLCVKQLFGIIQKFNYMFAENCIFPEEILELRVKCHLSFLAVPNSYFHYLISATIHPCWDLAFTRTFIKDYFRLAWQESYIKNQISKNYIKSLKWFITAETNQLGLPPVCFYFWILYNLIHLIIIENWEPSSQFEKKCPQIK